MSREETKRQIEICRKEVRALKGDLKAHRSEKRDHDLREVFDLGSWSSLRGMPADALGDVRCRRTLRGQRYDTRKVYDLCWGRKNRVLSASQEGMLVLWNAETGTKEHGIALDSAWVMACGLSEDATLTASGGLDNICVVHDLKSGEKDAAGNMGYKSVELQGHSGYIGDCKFINECQVVTASGDLTCRLWDLADGSARRRPSK